MSLEIELDLIWSKNNHSIPRNCQEPNFVFENLEIRRKLRICFRKRRPAGAYFLLGACWDSTFLKAYYVPRNLNIALRYAILNNFLTRGSILLGLQMGKYASEDQLRFLSNILNGDLVDANGRRFCGVCNRNVHWVYWVQVLIVAYCMHVRINNINKAMTFRRPNTNTKTIGVTHEQTHHAYANAFIEIFTNTNEAKQ